MLSEDRYVCVSQGMEDQVSTTLSLAMNNKDDKVYKKESNDFTNENNKVVSEDSSKSLV